MDQLIKTKGIQVPITPIIEPFIQIDACTGNLSPFNNAYAAIIKAPIVILAAAIVKGGTVDAIIFRNKNEHPHTVDRNNK
jgi:hypothetical protein